jgi:hypothetical protein
MRKAFVWILSLAAIAGLSVYLAADAAQAFGWCGLKAHLLGLGTGAFIILYVIGGAANLFIGTPWGDRKRR